MSDVLVGIASFGGNKNQPIDNCIGDENVFIRVSAFSDWIKQNMALGPHDNEETNKPAIFWWPF